jgi:hypothetical protein
MEPIKTAEKPAEKTIAAKPQKYIANGNIYHEGVDYAEGQEIEVSEPLAKIWLESGTIQELPKA